MKCRCASVLVLRLAPFDQVPTRRPLPQRAGAAPLPQQAAAALFLFHRTCRRVCAYVCVCVCVRVCVCFVLCLRLRLQPTRTTLIVGGFAFVVSPNAQEHVSLRS